MKDNIEIITRGDDVFFLTEDTETVNVQKAVGYVAMSVYSMLVDRGREKDNAKKQELETEIRFQSKVLDSLSNACLAINKAR